MYWRFCYSMSVSSESTWPSRSYGVCCWMINLHVKFENKDMALCSKLLNEHTNLILSIKIDFFIEFPPASLQSCGPVVLFWVWFESWAAGGWVTGLLKLRSDVLTDVFRRAAAAVLSIWSFSLFTLFLQDEEYEEKTDFNSSHRTVHVYGWVTGCFTG